MSESLAARFVVPFPFFQRAVIRRLAFACSLAFAPAIPAAAQSISARATGLSGTFTSFDFNGLPVALEGNLFTNQFAGSGVTFAGAYFGTQNAPLYGPFPSNALYNYGNFQPVSEMITVFFAGVTNAVAFNFAAFQGTHTFKAWHGSTERGSIVTTLPGLTAEKMGLWWGFEFSNGTTFDRLTIESNQSGAFPTFGFDNLQVRTLSSVPEPETIGLVGGGLLALGAAARRRRRQ